jgi:hypothetical protein
MNKKRDEDDSFTSEISCPFAMVALVLFDAKLNLTASDYRVYGQIYKRGYGSKKGCIQRQKGLCEEAGVKKSQFIESTNKLVALQSCRRPQRLGAHPRTSGPEKCATRRKRVVQKSGPQ